MNKILEIINKTLGIINKTPFKLNSLFLVVFLLLTILFPLTYLRAATNSFVGSSLSGRILLNVEGKGEAWYVNPTDNKRYYLGRPNDAFAVMRKLGLGVTEIDFQKIASSGMSVSGDLELAKRLSGKIILQTEKNGEAWYVNPVDLKKYYLGRPEDAFKVMRELGLGISRKNLFKVHKEGWTESIDQYSKYEGNKIINTSKGDFKIDLIEIDLNNPKLDIKSVAASPFPDPEISRQKEGYGAMSLADFAVNSNAFAGINATYFCSYSNCEAYNYYYFPFYDSITGTMINQDKLKYWTTGPMMVFDEKNNFYYFKDSREFKSVNDFETTYQTKIKAAFGNKPRLIENGQNLLIDWELDEKQKTAKTLRNAIAYKKDAGKGKLYLVIARQATVSDLADVMKAMQVDYAINLDGGYSSALIYNDEYMVGPGRNIPNAIIFTIQP